MLIFVEGVGVGTQGAILVEQTRTAEMTLDPTARRGG
jgi:hypothetical protein